MNVRRILNFDHSEQNLVNQPNQPNMSEQYTPVQLEEYKRIAEANDNLRLYRLKKGDQQKICIHYGINKVGTKPILEKRIIGHRDESMVFREFTEQEKKKVYSSYHIYGNRISWCFLNTFRKKASKDHKINLIVLYHKLCLIKVPEAEGTQHGAFETLYNTLSIRSKNTIIKKIIDIFNIINESVERERDRIMQRIRDREERDRQLIIDREERERVRLERNREEEVERRRNMKKVNIQNLTNQNIHVYWTDIREDAPDYSICRKVSTLRVGCSKYLCYTSDTTKIIISKVELNGNVII